MENRQYPSDIPLPDELLGAIRSFVYTVPVGRLSKALRNMFLAHIYNESDVPSLDLEDFVLDLQALFDLLDVAEQVCVQGPACSNKAKGSSSL